MSTVEGGLASEAPTRRYSTVRKGSHGLLIDWLGRVGKACRYISVWGDKWLERMTLMELLMLLRIEELMLAR
jgi:hypothetical protein